MKITSISKIGVKSTRTVTISFLRTEEVRPGYVRISPVEIELPEEEAVKLYAELRKHVGPVGYRTQP